MAIRSRTLFDEAPPASVGPPSRLQKRILVADDDAAIRELYRTVLLACDYRIDSVEDGAAAWQMLKAGRVRHDLLITDHCMPHLSGVELVHRLRAERMALPVILASGAVPENATSLELAAILEKPFSRVFLARTVQDVLHAANGAVRQCWWEM